MDNCTIDCLKIIGNYTEDLTCQYAQKECIQDTVQYVQMYYCDLNQSFILLIFISVSPKVNILDNLPYADILRIEIFDR